MKKIFIFGTMVSELKMYYTAKEIKNEGTFIKCSNDEHSVNVKLL